MVVIIAVAVVFVAIVTSFAGLRVFRLLELSSCCVCFSRSFTVIATTVFVAIVTSFAGLRVFRLLELSSCCVCFCRSFTVTSELVLPQTWVKKEREERSLEARNSSLCVCRPRGSSAPARDCNLRAAR